MSALSPMLASQHNRQVSVEVPNDTGNFVLKTGVLTLVNTKIESRDPVTGRPAVFYVDPDGEKKVRKRLGLKEQQVARTLVPPADSPICGGSTYAFCPQMEVAALKVSLLTFDDILRNHGQRFTRSARLQEVRDFVRTTIESGKCVGANLNRFSLGIQYDRLDVITKLRAKLTPPKSAFEHVLIASGNMGTRTLDIVWLIAGTDPFGFRVCHNWDGGDFTCTVVNEMLKGGNTYKPFWGNLPANICGQTKFRTFSETVPTENEAKQIVNEVVIHRQYMYQQAIKLVEFRCDDFVVKCIVNEAVHNLAGGHAIEAAFRNCLERRFHLRLKDPAHRQAFERIVQRRLNKMPVTMRKSFIHAETDKRNMDWSAWLQTYRQILFDLEPKMGLPGEIFAKEISIEGLPAQMDLQESAPMI